MLFGQLLVLFVYVNQLQLTYNVLWNKDNLISCQLCNHHLDQLSFFECYHMSSYHFFTGWSKKFCPSIITLWSFICVVGSKYLVSLLQCALPWNDRANNLFNPWKLGSTKKSKYCFCPLLTLLIDFFPVNCSLKTRF